MHKSRWNTTLILVRPESPRILKFRFTKTAIVILLVSCLISFVGVVVMRHVVGPLSMRDSIRLEQENQELKVKNLNIAAGAAKMETRVDQLEQQAQHILELVNTE
jgi:cell division protein FtsL